MRSESFIRIGVRDRTARASATNNYIHNNVVITRQSPQGATGMVADYDIDNILANGNNVFDYNVYHVTDISQIQWAWGQQAANLYGFQQMGHDVHSTLTL